MFCSECGNQVKDQLRYCNNCGARVKREDETKSKDNPLGLLISSLPFIILGGLGILVGLLAMLLNKGVSHEGIGVIAVAYLITLAAICFSLIRMMSKLITIKTKEKAESSNQFFQPVQLPAPNTAQLEEPKQQPFSVVDNTTRTFDEAFVKRN
jgi:hypothetical protein